MGIVSNIKKDATGGRVKLQSSEALQLEKILNNLKEVKGVSYTRTAIVMSTLKFEVSTGLSE